MPTKKYDDFLIRLLNNPDEIVEYLNAALEEYKLGDAESQELLLMACKNVAQALETKLQ